MTAGLDNAILIYLRSRFLPKPCGTRECQGAYHALSLPQALVYARNQCRVEACNVLLSHAMTIKETMMMMVMINHDPLIIIAVVMITHRAVQVAEVATPQATRCGKKLWNRWSPTSGAC